MAEVQLISEGWNTDPSSRWYFSTTNWELSTSEYVSSPKSLRETINATVEFILPLWSAYPDLHNVPEGEINSWFRPRFRVGRQLGFNFRNQASQGSSSALGYRLNLHANTVDVLVRYNATDEVVASWTVSIAENVWSRWSIMWWNVGADLALELRSWDGAEWVSEGIKYGLDANSHNQYKNSAINRAGLLLSFQSYIDDTVILKGPPSGFIWVEDTDTPVDRLHITTPGGIERTNLATADVDDAPVDGATTDPISSNWAYDYEQLWEDKKKIIYLGL